jgi:hypothetical protein
MDAAPVRVQHPRNTPTPEGPMPHETYYDASAATVTFWVEVDGVPVRAIIGKATLHYRYQKNSSTDDPLVTYEQHAVEIGEAVRRRLAAGSREPIILRDRDVAAQPAA